MSARLLHLLRHGAPQRPGLLLGRTDAASTSAGNAACLARARGLALDAVMSSDLSRARDAAKAIADRDRLPLAVDPRWRELDFGVWDGLHPASIDPPMLDRFYEDPDGYPPPKGERWSDLVDRVGAAIAGRPAGDILVLTHGGTMRAALAHLCGFAPAQLWSFDLPYAALLTLRIWAEPDGGAQIVGLRA